MYCFISCIVVYSINFYYKRKYHFVMYIGNLTLITQLPLQSKLGMYQVFSVVILPGIVPYQFWKDIIYVQQLL